MRTTELRLSVEGMQTVSALWQLPAKARAVLVLAHGAGAGMTHPSMVAIADGLAARQIASLRYQFPYMERQNRRVDSPAVAHAAVRAAVGEGSRRARKLPLFAGGKSFGGRMTSQAQAIGPLPSIRGLVLFGFPLHPAGEPSDARAAHLADIAIPMLFLQGTRDALADVALITRTIRTLGKLATLELFKDADHSFHVPRSTGRTDAEVLAAVLDRAAEWILAVAG